MEVNQEISRARADELSGLEVKLGLKFNDRTLLNTALTHASYAHQKRRERLQSNERLEFFGDAVLKLAVSEALWQRYPGYNEGQLTKVRAVLISDRILARIGRDLGLGEYLLLGPTERAGSGRKRPSALANALEAVFAAAYFDLGYSAARDLILRLLTPYVEKAVRQEIEGDWKSALQELVQRQGWPLPVYRVIKEEGPQHRKVFQVEAVVQKGAGGKNVIKTESRGCTKKEAEQAAAQQILQKYFPLT